MPLQGSPAARSGKVANNAMSIIINASSRVEDRVGRDAGASCFPSHVCLAAAPSFLRHARRVRTAQLSRDAAAAAPRSGCPTGFICPLEHVCPHHGLPSSHGPQDKPCQRIAVPSFGRSADVPTCPQRAVRGGFARIPRRFSMVDLRSERVREVFEYMFCVLY
eukprot:COSAG05_NODE_1919_length_3833_cov_3.495179_2_plen_163_part_00